MLQHRTATVNGKPTAYTTETVFLVQVGKGPKGAYKTRFTFLGNLKQAWFWFDGINIGKGFKKRIVAVGLNKPVLARVAS